MIRLNKHKDDSFLSVFIHDVVGSVRLACYFSRAAESGDPALRPASGERIHTSPSGGSKVQVNERNAMRARTWREAKRKLLTRQSQIPYGPKPATNKFGFSSCSRHTCRPTLGIVLGLTQSHIQDTQSAHWK